MRLCPAEAKCRQQTGLPLPLGAYFRIDNLVTEIFRRARENLVSLVQVQTSSTNQAAMSLYQTLGFQPIDQATLYRLPAHCTERTRLP